MFNLKHYYSIRFFRASSKTAEGAVRNAFHPCRLDTGKKALSKMLEKEER